jgi:hypothetical protein
VKLDAKDRQPEEPEALGEGSQADTSEPAS